MTLEKVLYYKNLNRDDKFIYYLTDLMKKEYKITLPDKFKCIK